MACEYPSVLQNLRVAIIISAMNIEIQVCTTQYPSKVFIGFQNSCRWLIVRLLFSHAKCGLGADALLLLQISLLLLVSDWYLFVCRCILIDWLAEVVTVKNFSSHILHQTVAVMDSVITSKQKIPRSMLQLLAISCLVLSSRYI